MAVTIRVGDTGHRIPDGDAAVLVNELRHYATGDRGAIGSPDAAIALGHEIDDRLSGRGQGAVTVDDPAALDALHRVLNAIVHEVGPAMQLYSAVDAALRAA
jgi:hypothetical protein